MAGPGDKAVTTKDQDHGRLRASESEREQVVGALQAAFVQGRLTEDEFEARMAQVPKPPAVWSSGRCRPEAGRPSTWGAA